MSKPTRKLIDIATFRRAVRTGKRITISAQQLAELIEVYAAAKAPPVATVDGVSRVSLLVTAPSDRVEHLQAQLGAVFVYGAAEIAAVTGLTEAEAKRRMKSGVFRPGELTDVVAAANGATEK